VLDTPTPSWIVVALVATATALVVGAGVALGLFAARRARQRRAIAREVAKPTRRAPAQAAFYYRSLDESLPTFHRRRPELDAQSAAWRRAWHEVGVQIAAGGVRTIYYAHGTFVGGDPLGIAELLRELRSERVARLADLTSALTKRGADWLSRDLGNFPPPYLALCREGLDAGLVCRDFHWSSGNNHLARVRGALTLLAALARDVAGDPAAAARRTLLIGHSHAGQVFALMTQLIGDGATAEAVRRIVVAAKLVEPVAFAAARAAVAPLALDFVTLGTPPVYEWRLGTQHRLMHVINHRGRDPEGGGPLGALVTKAGDYVQQYGVSGSDTLALSRRERHLNMELDEALGRGFSLTAWAINLRSRRRLPTTGEAYLVDFRDASPLRPNFHKTAFGHGVYTRYQVMLYLHRLIAGHFYPR
jgi:hypothetical protein